MTRLSFRFAKRKSTAWCRWALRFACSVLAAAVSVDIPAEERGTGAVVSLDHSAADLKVPPDAGVIPVPGTDPIRIAVITFALPRDNLLIAEATKLALAPLFPNRGIKLIFCTFEEFDRIVLSRGAEFILGTSGAVTRLSTFGLRPLATLVSKGGSDPNRNEGSAVIVREDHREFQTLGDLKGRTIAASNALSFPGWQIVLGEVAKFGINPNAFFGKTIFTGDARSISDIVKLVLDDKADAGVLRLCAYEQFIERHPEAVGELRVLDRRDNMDVACVHSTDLYPGFTMAVTELISPEAARRATLALLSMPPTERGARWTISTNYKSVDALLRIEAGSSQPQAGSSQKSNGLGLGLAIVRSIVEACFGAITFGRTDLNPRLTGLAVRVALPLVSTSQSGRTETDVSIPVPHEPAAESAQSLPKDSKDPSK